MTRQTKVRAGALAYKLKEILDDNPAFTCYGFYSKI